MPLTVTDDAEVLACVTGTVTNVCAGAVIGPDAVCTTAAELFTVGAPRTRSPLTAAFGTAAYVVRYAAICVA